MVSNEGKITTFGTTGTLGGLVDGTDKLHSGILKTLWNVSNGSRVVSSGTFTQSSNRFTLAGTVVYRSLGTKYTLAGNNYADVTAGHSTYDRYDLIYIDRSADALAIAAGTPAAQSTVADIAPEDVPVAIVKVAAGAAATATHNFQVLLSTFDKDVLNDDEVTYAKIQNVSATDRILGRDSSGAGVIEEITPANLRTMINVADGATAYADANAVAAVEAESTLVLQSGVTVGTDLKLSTSSDNVIVENVTQDKDIIFKVNDGGASTEVMRIDGDVSRVGIGTDTPDKLVHLSATTDATLRIESTKTSVAANDVVGAIEWEGQDSSTGSAGVGAKIDVINENATPDFAMRFFTQKAVGGTPTFSEKIRIASDGKVGIGTTSPSNTLDVNGDVSGDKFLVETVQYELEILSNAGATPGPPTPAFSLADTDTIYRVSTVAGTPPGTGNIDLSLPATATNIGVVFKLIVTALDGASPLTIGPNTGDNIVSETLSVLAASGATHTISSTGVYELVCFSGSWMFYKIA